jgi:hypothetical protein
MVADPTSDFDSDHDTEGTLAEVVVGLHTKIDNAKNPHRLAMEVMNYAAALYVLSAIVHDFASVPSLSLDDTVLSAFDAYTML